MIGFENWYIGSIFAVLNSSLLNSESIQERQLVQERNINIAPQSNKKKSQILVVHNFVTVLHFLEYCAGEHGNLMGFDKLALANQMYVLPALLQPIWSKGCNKRPQIKYQLWG